MNGAGTRINLTFGLIDSNRRFIMLYLGCAVVSSIVYTVEGPLWGFALYILMHYLVCGLLGALKQDINTGNTPSFADFHKYGKRYFLKLFGCFLVIGSIIAVFAVAVLAIVLIAGFLVPLLMPIGIDNNFISGDFIAKLRAGFFRPWTSIIVFVLGMVATVWRTCADSLIVYHDRGILEAVRGSLTVLAENKLIMSVYVAIMIIGQATVFVVTMRGISLNYWVAVVALYSLILSASLVIVYTTVFLSLKERTLSRA